MLCSILKSVTFGLFVTGNQIGADGVKALANALKGGSLEILTLNGNMPAGRRLGMGRLGQYRQLAEMTQGMHALGEFLRTSVTLQYVSLTQTQLGPESATIIAVTVPNKLLELDVSDNAYITRKAAEQLGQAVRKHTSMEVFCGIPLPGLRNGTLTELNLEGKHIGDHGAFVISDLLANGSLVTLNLTGETQNRAFLRV